MENFLLGGFPKLQQRTNQGIHVIAEGCDKFIHVGAKGECIFAVFEGGDNDVECQTTKYLGAQANARHQIILDVCAAYWSS